MASTETMETKASLSSLACRAAIELDNLLIGRHDKGLASFSKLASLLNSRLTVSEGEAERSDPITLAMLRSALHDAGSTIAEPQRLQDLVNEAAHLTSRLERATGQSNHGELAALRTFCVALSKVAARYEHPIEDLESSHPFIR